MAKNVILSEETVSTLLEAHASLAAWYYELVRALQSQTPPAMPDEATRLAFMARLAQDFPEIAAVARNIKAPRTYVPPPPAFALPPAVVLPPGVPPGPPASPKVAAAPLPEAAATILPVGPVVAPPGAPPAPPALAPPPLVLPGTVKYE